MKRIKRDRVKRGRIILSAILTLALSLLSLGFGGYLGYVTLNINYVTIGTMTTEVGGLLVVAGFFIFFGVIGGGIALKEMFIARKNEDRFEAFKGALYSAVVFYVVIAIISLCGIVSSFVSYVPSNFTWGIIALGILSLVLSGACFYCVFKELKEHKKGKKKRLESASVANTNQNGAFNMNLDAGEIHKFSSMSVPQSSSQGMQSSPEYSDRERQRKEENFSDRGRGLSDSEKKDILGRVISEKMSTKEEINFVSLAEQLMQLEEMRKAGLINDQEYQELKRKCI